jgi:hypothetical protein
MAPDCDAAAATTTRGSITFSGTSDRLRGSFFYWVWAPALRPR